MGPFDCGTYVMNLNMSLNITKQTKCEDLDQLG